MNTSQYVTETMDNDTLQVDITYPKNKSLTIRLNGRILFEQTEKRYITLDELKELLGEKTRPPVTRKKLLRSSPVQFPRLMNSYIDKETLLQLVEAAVAKNEGGNDEK